MQTLIVGNKGSFLNEISKRFLEFGLDYTVIHAEENIKVLLEKTKDIDVILYIGGETRQEVRMEQLNFLLLELIEEAKV